MKDFENRLKGGHPNSLGNTIEVVEEVLMDHSDFEELFNCYFSDDEVVRLRVSNAMKRICKAQKSLLLPYIDRLIDDVAQIDQASTQWTLAQLFVSLQKEMTTSQVKKATKIMKRNLAEHQDWIVLNTTMDTLSKWAKNDEGLKNWIRPHLQRIAQDSRKSVSSRAKKSIKMLFKD